MLSSRCFLQQAVRRSTSSGINHRMPTAITCTSAAVASSLSCRSMSVFHRAPPELCQTPECAVKSIKSGDTVFIHSIAAVPPALLKSMADRHAELSNITTCHIHIEGETPHLDHPDVFRDISYFVGKNCRKVVQSGQGEFMPIFLSEIPSLFDAGHEQLDVALITISPPDRHGFCSLGVSVDISYAAVMNAKCVIAQINRDMPRTHGDGIIHINNIDYVYEEDYTLPVLKPAPVDENVRAIGEHIASLVHDGACLQMGIGAIPDATLQFLTSHKDLGIHTEMMSEGVIDLYESGVITNRFKKIQPGHIVSSFLIGTKRLYDFVDDNPAVQMMRSDFVNNPTIIAQNNDVIAINSAIEVDISGQVCADSIGDKIYSGIGGQVDFERAAKLSHGGVPIIAMTARTNKGTSRIVPMLKTGAGVVTTRGHVHWVVTEYGKVNLFGKTMHERARLMISIAHPEDREDLERFAKQHHYM